mmetsp:Transcript_54892/g.67290  ORF Transcript_54892/g.67290 Transcript_54892/m.67290 type:complete len:1163 (-) Transcript_54892:163-3651(-)
MERIKQITEEIQDLESAKSDPVEHIQKSAKNLVKLQYLTQCLNYSTDTNIDTSNDKKKNKNANNDQKSPNVKPKVTESVNQLKKKVDQVIKQSMNFLSNNKVTKKKINVLYNNIIQVDPNYGSVFTQSQTVFKSSLQAVFNQRFRELDINGIIKSLKETRNEFQFPGLIESDFSVVRYTFNKISKKYTETVESSLRQSNSFEDLKESKIIEIGSDTTLIAAKARDTRKSKLDTLYKYVKSSISGGNDGIISKTVKNVGSWFSSVFSGSNAATGNQSGYDSRSCYWTAGMKKAIPDLIAGILSVWTLMDASCYYDSESDKNSTLKKARNAQIIAIMSILCIDFDTKNNKNSNAKTIFNNLVEVGTGEGKSLIMAVTAIVLALLGFDVYCACYSELLSNRDQESFNDLFVQFGVQNHIKYNTFNKIFEESINDGGNIREITKDIMLNKFSNADSKDDSKVDDKIAQQKFLDKRQKILFIDEVDKFFSTDFFGQQFAPSVLIPKQEISDLIKYIWQMYLDNNRDIYAITLDKIEESQEYKNVLNEFNEEWHDLIKESVKDMIDGIQTFKEDKSYKIINQRDVAYKFSDSYSTNVFKGYKTLFAYLNELNKGNINDEDYVNKKLGWSVKCGSFLYSQIPYDFYAILGVTGTLKSLSKKEHNVMQKSYGIRKYVVMPSLFDKAGKLDYSQNKDLLILSQDRFINELYSVIIRYQKNDDASCERPIIVFFEDEDRLMQFYNHDVCQVWKTDRRIQLLTPDLNESEKKNGILKATTPNQITLATEEYGRGIDFKVLDPKLETKGLHVELTYWPSTTAEEIQIKGRTARQGQYGSFHITLNEDVMIDLYDDVTKDSLDEAQKNGTLYNYLDGLRREIFGKKYDEAEIYVKELKPIHRQSELLAESLRNNDISKAKEHLLLFNKGANISSACKLAIIIDATGSMYKCISRCKTVISRTIPMLMEFLEENKIQNGSFEIQVIAYRNYNAPSDKILEYSQFTDNVPELTKFVHSVKAQYGLGREAIEIAFNQLNYQKKKPNVVLLMADAPAHTLKHITERREQSYGTSYWATQRNNQWANVKDWKQELNEFMVQNPESIFHCFWLNKRAQSNFEEIAQIGGNGKCKNLNIDNEEESIGTLQAALCETLLVTITGGTDILGAFRKKFKDIPTFL